MSAKSYGESNITQTRLRGSKRSPGRPRKSSRSPARKTSPPAQIAKKSPARKSPSRKPAAKSPARKSPSRVTKDVAEIAPQVVSPTNKEPSKRPALNLEPQVRLQNLMPNHKIFQTNRAKRVEYSVTDITSTHSDLKTAKVDKPNGVESLSSDIYNLRHRKFIEEVLPRRSSRLQEFIENLPSERKSLSKSVSHSKSRKSNSKSLEDYSDDEISGYEFKREKSKSVIRRLSTPLRSSATRKTPMKWEFGGLIGVAFLMILLPLAVLAIVTSCSKTCSLHTWQNLNQYQNLHTWFSWKTSGFVILQVFIQMFFAIIPIFGKKANRFDDKGTKYCFNAFFASIFIVSVLFLLDFCKTIDKNVILSDYMRLSTISYLLAVLLSIILFVKSSKIDEDELNSYGNTGYALYDYFVGREIHPFLKKLDVKIWISRISNVNTLILLLLIFSRGIQLQLNGNDKLTLENFKGLLFKVNLKPTIMIFSMMQIIYILNFIIREYKVTSTFFWNSEGVGYMQTVCSALYPFYFTTISKYVADTDLTLPNNILISALVIYVMGFLIMLLSNNIKHEFRSNPIHPSLAKFKSIPTFHGKKLLMSGLWGSLRHPNYGGDILMHLAFAIPGAMTGNVMAASPALITIVVLLHRAWRDHARCKTRYGAAWQNYCKRVPSVFIPKVL
ncbi:hypothetical protein K1T71_001141 [Dendrolimus kikuchii]|uniref:Uncharacterized protein n=1 Tax=Dendrolimus kikuchii TaxID=765133 RepID=A0ACC1DGX8_9NEOP|nr:hypothetical protein K1T71_001141 [Dendrolimus kikuchii]